MKVLGVALHPRQRYHLPLSFLPNEVIELTLERERFDETIRTNSHSLSKSIVIVLSPRAIVNHVITVAFCSFFLLQVDEAEMARPESRWEKGEGEALARDESYGEKLRFLRQKGNTCLPPSFTFSRTGRNYDRRRPL